MSATIETPEYLTVAEAAALLRVHPRTILNRIRDGRLPAKRLQGGKTSLIARADALALLQDVSPARPEAPAPERLAPSPLIDRLGTPEGRARALAMLRRLREEGDIEEQRRAWEVLKDGVTPLELRRWSPDSEDSAATESGDAHEDAT